MLADLTLLVVGKDEVSLRGYLDAQSGSVEGSNPRTFPADHRAAAELVLIANQNNESLASIANRYLDAARTSVFGLIHADCYFGPGALERFTAAAQKSVCGIVGITERDVYCWCFQNPARVQTLDSCSVFFRRDTGLRFDPVVFDGMHCHVQDLCLQAHAKGIPVLVPQAEATHRGINFAEPAWRADFERYRGRLHAKWEKRYPVIKLT